MPENTFYLTGKKLTEVIGEYEMEIYSGVLKIVQMNTIQKATERKIKKEN